jgi:anti-anti-sigma factor
MEIASRELSECILLEIRDPVLISHSIGSIETMVEDHIARGARNFGLRFHKDSFLNSSSLAVILRCYERIVEAGGKLAIVNPTDEISGMLGMLDLNTIIPQLDTEEELADLMRSTD